MSIGHPTKLDYRQTTFAVLAALILSCTCWANEPTSRPVSDAENTFSVKIAEDWTRTDKNIEGDGLKMELDIYKKGRGEVTFANIYISQDGRPADVRKFVQFVLDSEKERSPELNKDCQVETTKVDGVDAYRIKFRHRGNHYAEYFVCRGDRCISINTMVRDSDLEQMQQKIKDVIDTFSWTKQK